MCIVLERIVFISEEKAVKPLRCKSIIKKEGKTVLARLTPLISIFINFVFVDREEIEINFLVLLYY
jgi:hypothetical protein